MIVKGRNIHQPIVQAQCQDDRFTIRIDDARMLDFWLELEFTAEELKNLFMLRHMRGEAEFCSSNVPLVNDATNSDVAGEFITSTGQDQSSLPQRTGVPEQRNDGSTASGDSTG